MYACAKGIHAAPATTGHLPAKRNQYVGLSFFCFVARLMDKLWQSILSQTLAFSLFLFFSLRLLLLADSLLVLSALKHNPHYNSMRASLSLSLSLSIYLSIYLSINLYLSLPLSVYVCMCVCSYLSLSVELVFVHLSTYVYIYPSILISCTH
ncbi:unnamed protein product [Acanthosepion pharaonis]|uniref:Uncharacterized protein n=1 Tax=Acanthosepion pharaonis TaxID=158019 RepID=A0A812E3Q7_ACAPH|nr:unnamed protein product [Sepia pharaonis]